MAAGISIGVGADTRAFAQGVAKGIVEPLEDVQDTFKRTSEAGDRAGEQLEDSLKGSQAATERFGREYEQMSDRIKAASRSTGREIGDDYKHGAHQANEAVDTVKENTAANLKEVAASFDGSAQSLAGGFQGLAAEILEGFGPGGLIAGAVIAGGIGLISTGLENNAEKAQEFQADVASLSQELIAAGRAGEVSNAQIADGLTALASQTDPAKLSLQDLQRQAKLLGLSFREVAQANAKGGDAAQYAIDKTNRLIDAEKRRHIEQQAAVGQNVTLLNQGDGKVRSLEQQRDKLVEQQREVRAAQRAEKEWLAAGGQELQDRGEALDSYTGSVQDYLRQAGAEWETYAGKQGESLDKYAAHLEKSLEATRDYQDNVKTVSKTLTQDALNYVLSLGEDAAPLLEKFVDAPSKMQDRIAASWDEIGKKSSSSYTAALEGGIPKTIDGPRIILPPINPPDLVGLVGGMQAYLDRHPLRAGAVAVTRYGKPLF